MPKEHHFEFPLSNGLHARPASQLEAVASHFASVIGLYCGRNSNHADVHSVLSLISADIRLGDSCVLRIEGVDEDAAFATLVEYLIKEFPHCDEALPGNGDLRAPNAMPRVLAALGVKHWWPGQAVAGDIALARVLWFDGVALAENFTWPVVESAETECRSLTIALALANDGLAEQIRASSREAAGVLRAQLSILSDPSLASRVERQIHKRACSVGEALMVVTEEISAKLREGSAYLQERVADIRDVSARLLVSLYGETAVRQAPVMNRSSIVVASELTPGQFLSLDRRHLAGIVLENGGGTSHTAILARAAGIPTLAGVKGIRGLADGTEAVLDVRRGVLVAELSEEIRNFYQIEIDRVAERSRKAEGRCRIPAASADGVALPCLANVSTAEEIGAAIERGAEGVGLFRTELLFMNRESAPGEDEQFQVYLEAVRLAEARPLVIRTLDIGGDKPVSYLDLPVEENPFLGVRGVRLYERFPTLIRTQLRAILRASSAGDVRIMVPMISSVEEMSVFRKLVDDVRAELTSDGHAIREGIAVGAMLEVPSAVFALAGISRFADFFSVGTNDLAQYFMAADRGNSNVEALASWNHPSFLRLLEIAVRSARGCGRPIGLCGDLACQPEALPILLGLGFDSLSMGAADIPRAKMVLSKLAAAAARSLLDQAMEAESRVEVDAALASARSVANVRLLTKALFQAECAASNKVEVINELISLADASGRVKNAVALEEATWAREETYPTNFGHGFAVPHCHTTSVSSPVIALVRMKRPIRWTPGEDGAVHIALLLAMPAGENEAHLRIFAHLSRMIMRAEFRIALEAARDSGEMLSALEEALAPVLQDSSGPVTSRLAQPSISS